MTIQTNSYTLPAYWASYLINGDASGLSEEDKTACDAWLDAHPGEYPVDCSEQYFSWRNDANGLGGDVCEYTFHAE